MNTQVPWTVTHEDTEGNVSVKCVSASVSIRHEDPYQLSLELGMGRGRVVSMLRGNHTASSITFQPGRDDG